VDLTSLVTKIQIFLNVTPCRQGSSYRRCDEAQWFHLQHQAVQKESTTLFRNVETPTWLNIPDDVNLHIVDWFPTYFRKSPFSPCRKSCRITDVDITRRQKSIPFRWNPHWPHSNNANLCDAGYKEENYKKCREQFCKTDSLNMLKLKVSQQRVILCKEIQQI
jgi:hypothetical protein